MQLMSVVLHLVWSAKGFLFSFNVYVIGIINQVRSIPEVYKRPALADAASVAITDHGKSGNLVAFLAGFEFVSRSRFNCSTYLYSRYFYTIVVELKLRKLYERDICHHHQEAIPVCLHFNLSFGYFIPITFKFRFNIPTQE